MEVRLVCRLQPKVHWVPEIYYKFGTLEKPCGFHGLVCQAARRNSCHHDSVDVVTSIRGKDYGRGFLEKEAFGVFA